jgi:hypothetical protein
LSCIVLKVREKRAKGGRAENPKSEIRFHRTCQNVNQSSQSF